MQIETGEQQDQYERGVDDDTDQMSYPEAQDDVAELLLCHAARGAEHRHIGDGHHKGPGSGHTNQLDDLGGTVEGQPELQRSAQDCGHCHIAECQG